MANNKKKENVYDPLEDIKRFTYNKGLYDQAVAKGDNVAARQYGDAGMTGYINLQNNGYGDLAKQLGDTDYQGALKIQNEYSKKGKVPIRDYFLGSKLKTQYGMTDQQINDNFKFDESTGEVSFGGMKLGSPYSNVDGTTYWDSGVLDKYIDDYIGYSGITPVTTSVDTKTQQLSDLQFSDHNNMNTKYDELYDFSMNANPFETDTGKAIMDEYSLKALQGKENELASGASSNSGNIDSYSQANALRQQAALTSKGQQMAIAAQSQRINDVRGVLGDLGGYQSNSYKGIQNTIGMQMEDEQRKFDNDEAIKAREHKELTDIANITGYTPSAWLRETNPYFNSEGTLAYPDMDYIAEIERLYEKGKAETDPAKKASIDMQINYLLDAHGYKTNENNYGGKWAQYAKDIAGYNFAPTPTLSRSQTDYNHALGLGTNAIENKKVEYGHEENMGANATADKKVEYGHTEATTAESNRHEEAMGAQAIDGDSVSYTILSDKIDKGIPISDEDAKKLGFASAEEFKKNYESNNANGEQDKYRKELYNNVIAGMPITKDDLIRAGYPKTMTVDEYYKQITSNKSLLGADETKNAAISQVLAYAASGATIPPSLLEDAGFGDMTSEQFYEQMNKNNNPNAENNAQSAALATIQEYTKTRSPIPQSVLKTAGFGDMTSEQYYAKLDSNIDPDKKDQKQATAMGTVLSLASTRSFIPQYLLKDAGFGDMTSEQYYEKLDSNIDPTVKDAKQQEALSYVYTAAATGAPIPKSILKDAGFGDITDTEFYKSYNEIQKGMNKDGKSQQALQNIYSAVVQGLPITQDDLDAAGFKGMTPDQFTEKYLKNLGNIYEVQKKNNAVSTSGSGNGSSSKTKDESPKKVVSDTKYDAFVKAYDEGGKEGLRKELDKFDWSTYDIDAVASYFKKHYPNDRLADFFTSYSAPGTEKETENVSAGWNFVSTYQYGNKVVNGKIQVEGLGSFTEAELETMYNNDEVDLVMGTDGKKYWKAV